MTDNNDIKDAQARLQGALKSLEGAIVPLLNRVTALEKQAGEAGAFNEDRAKLAASLDETKAELEQKTSQFQSRETEFNALADETTEELDRVIKQMRGALDQET